jgi:O-antigen ligase
MSFLHKSFLIRRRIDTWALGAGAAAMPVRIGFGPLVLFVFSCIGIYLVSGRHRTAHLFARNFYICAVLYGIWSLGLILLRGEPIMHNRQISYTLLFTIFAFAGPGMVLARDPLRVFVLGSRAGILLAFLAAVALAIFGGGRIGVGGNPAVFAFVAGVAAIGATIPIAAAPRFLPNGAIWLILGAGAVVTSQTRAVLAVLPIFALVEILAYIRKAEPRTRMVGYVVLAVVAVGIGSYGPVHRVIDKRFAGMVHYYDTGDPKKWEDKRSADIRFALWDGAVKVISEHPLLGVGPSAKMEAVRAKEQNGPALVRFRHVHNIILDELLNNGLIGLILMLACLWFGLSHLYRHSDSACMKRCIAYFVIVCASYGMLHNPLLHETTIAAIFFFIGALNAAASRRIMAERRALAG